MVKGERVSDRVQNCSTGVMNNIRNALRSVLTRFSEADKVLFFGFPEWF